MKIRIKSRNNLKFLNQFSFVPQWCLQFCQFCGSLLKNWAERIGFLLFECCSTYKIIDNISSKYRFSSTFLRKVDTVGTNFVWVDFYDLVCSNNIIAFRPMNILSSAGCSWELNVNLSTKKNILDWICCENLQNMFVMKLNVSEGFVQGVSLVPEDLLESNVSVFPIDVVQASSRQPETRIIIISF